MFVSRTVLRKNRNTDFLIYLIYNQTVLPKRFWADIMPPVCDSILLHANIHVKSSRP